MGTGCFFNGQNVYSTEAACSTAVGVPGHSAVCKELPPSPYISGGTDGSCPVGSVRVQLDECQTLAGSSIEGRPIELFGREDCAAHFTPGTGCFFNGRNVYSTTAACATAAGVPGHSSVCKPLPPSPHISGGTDGSCPVGFVRVALDEGETMAGTSIEGRPVALFGREDCASHFTPGTGCFFNGQNVYSTRAACSTAVGVPGHSAVCKELPPSPYISGGTDGTCPVGYARVQLHE